MEKGTFGERLKREREMRGVGLEEIAAATRISTRFLEALEREQWDRLPGGIFNRGFIRAISRFLGLDEDSLVAEYAAAAEDRPAVTAWSKSGEKPRPAMWPWAVLLLVIASGAAGWATYHFFHPRIAAWWKPLRSAHAAASRTALLPVAVKSVPASAPVPPYSGAGPASAVNPAEPATLELKVEAGKPTRVNVVADGRTVFAGRLAAGASREFLAKNKFDVSADDPSAVLLELNGQTVPPLGPPQQPAKVTLTRKDLKKPQGGQD